MTDVSTQLNLDEAIRSLRKDWSFLAPVLRALDHEVSTECANLRLRLHYPGIRQAQPVVEAMIAAVATYIAHFCLPRTEIEEVYARKDELDPFQFHSEVTRLNDRARALFQKARAGTDRTGEAGELLLYVLTEWMLDAPQIVAKMSLKTNSEMPVYGADGIHARYDASSGKLLIYSGEAKLHKDVRKAIASAVESIGKALSYDKVQHELMLVQRNVQFSGLDRDARIALLRYLDPFQDAADDQQNVITCLIGFDFAGYLRLEELGDNAEKQFRELASASLSKLGPAVAKALRDAGLASKMVELFFLPLPSVGDVRDRFKRLVGLKS